MSILDKFDPLNSPDRLVKITLEPEAYAKSFAITKDSKAVGGQFLPNGHVEVTWLRNDETEPVIKKLKCSATEPVRDGHILLFKIEDLGVYEIIPRGVGRQNDWQLTQLQTGTQIITLPAGAEINRRCPTRRIGGRLRLCWRADMRRKVRPFVIVVCTVGHPQASQHVTDANELARHGRVVKIPASSEDVALYVDTQLVVSR